MSILTTIRKATAEFLTERRRHPLREELVAVIQQGPVAWDLNALPALRETADTIIGNGYRRPATWDKTTALYTALETLETAGHTTEGRPEDLAPGDLFARAALRNLRRAVACHERQEARQ